MRILIVSSTPWDISNCFGNTFSNLFDGMKDIEIWHVCCRYGSTNGTLAVKTFQMTDKSVMRSILHRKTSVGWIVDTGEKHIDNVIVSETVAKKRHSYAFFVRDMIWSLGTWRRDSGLLDFIREANPDVIYLPVYAACHMCDVQQFIIEKLNKPVVGHISDDLFAVSPDADFLKRVYSRKLAKKLTKLITRCSYLEVFAENMQQEYSKRFHIPAYLIGKGVDVIAIPEMKISDKGKEKHFVFTGNLGSERWKTLVLIGEAFSKYNGEGILDIYSATALTDEMKKAFDGCRSIRFHGSVSSDEVKTIQENADILVHVEGFSLSSISSTRMSFSTKLIDYMMVGKPILAVGDATINSIAVLKKYDVAIVATSAEGIEIKIDELLSGNIDIEKLDKNVTTYLKTFRDIHKIQTEMKNRLDCIGGNLYANSSD